MGNRSASQSGHAADFSISPPNSVTSTEGQDTSSCTNCGSEMSAYSFSAITCLEIFKTGSASEDQVYFELVNVQSLGTAEDARCEINTNRQDVSITVEKQRCVHNCSDMKRSLKKLRKIRSVPAEEVMVPRKPKFPPTPPESLPDSPASTSVTVNYKIPSCTLSELTELKPNLLESNQSKFINVDDILTKVCSMGVTTSALELPPPEDYLTQCCLALRECSSIRLIHAPRDLKDIVQATVEKRWAPGGDRITDTDAIWEYRLKGLPFWNSFSPQRSLQVHSLVCYLLDEMQKLGWDVQTATDLSRSKDLSTFFLKRRTKARVDSHIRDEPVRPGDRNRMMFSATLADKNKVHVVNASALCINQLYTIFTNHWSKGVQRVTRNKHGTIFTLKGEPWSDGKAASIQASSLVHRLIYTIGLLGWDVNSIARVKNFRDTMFFKQKRMKKFDDLVGCFLSVSFYGKNRLRLIHCSEPDIAMDIENFLAQTWEPGLENTRKIHGTIEFRLIGKPFWSDSTDGIDSKLLVCALLAMLQKKGWRIHHFISATRSLENKGTLLFKKEPSSDVSPMCISFDDEDKIRLISATDDVKCTVRTVITQRLGANGIVREGNFRNCWEFKLHGAPWTGISSEEGIKVRSLLIHILQKLSFKGWHVMTSFDVCSKINKSDDRHPQPLDAQSWYLCKKESLGIMFDKWKKNAEVEPTPSKTKTNGVPNNMADKPVKKIGLGDVVSEVTIGVSAAIADPENDVLIRSEDLATPESSLTNLIRDMKTEVDLEKKIMKKDLDLKELEEPVQVATFIETVDAESDCEEIEHLMIEEDSIGPVMCSLNSANLMPYDCKSISPAPSQSEEFEIPEIKDDFISTIFSDPPVFDKK